MNPKVGFGEAFKLFWKNYFNFKGRSRRSEFWFMQLWHLIFYGPALILYIMALIMIMFAAGFQSEGLSILSVVMFILYCIN